MGSGRLQHRTKIGAAGTIKLALPLLVFLVFLASGVGGAGGTLSADCAESLALAPAPGERLPPGFAWLRA